MDEPSFNLVDSPWIGVRTLAGELELLSLLDVFRNAAQIERLANDVPTQDFALLRLLEAVLMRSIVPLMEEADDEGVLPVQLWGRLWGSTGLPMNEIEQYLKTWHDSFYLFGGKRPFMQEADLVATNEKVTEIGKIIADVPDNEPYFTMRAGKELQSISAAEAARWVVHTHAFDPSGIKTATKGDPAVKGGKSYPIGTGWAGFLGGVYIEGSNLQETLLLNLYTSQVLDHTLFPLEDPEDLPAWERVDQNGRIKSHAPSGPIDLFTWQSRRMRLVCDKDGRVSGVVLTNATKIEPYDMQSSEPMSAWRRNKEAEKRLKRALVFSPKTHQPDRALWRGLESILPTANTNSSTARELLPPDVVSWVGFLAGSNGADEFSNGYPVRLHSTGIKYGTNSAIIEQIIDDSLVMSAFLLTPEGEHAANLAKECMQVTDEVVWYLGNLGRNLAAASGGSGKALDGPRDAAKERAYFELDAPFRFWLSSLNQETSLSCAQQKWYDQARRIIRGTVQSMIEAAPPQAHIGSAVHNKDGSQTWMTAARAEQIFNSYLDKKLPRDHADRGLSKVTTDVVDTTASEERGR